MFAIVFITKGVRSVSPVHRATEDLAWRGVHELLEEAYGDNYGEAELAEYDVVAV